MSAVATPPRPPMPRPQPPASMPPEPPKGDLWKKMLLAIAVIVVLSGVTAGVYTSGEINTVVKAIRQNPSLKVQAGQLAPAGSGSPQTLLLVGDDQRALTKYYHHAVLPHSNEMLLVRFDPAKPYISMMSIPRDLNVPIILPRGGVVTTRFNFAYTAGGIPTLLDTIKRILGLKVNHVVVITFARFKRAVDEMGCVYSTIDHRYFHSNVGSVQQYQEINLQPGYQRLCGPEALSFVSYRHGDTALVRDARNQSFLLDVKNQFGPSLFANRDKFEQIFGRAVQTDPTLHSTGGVLNLLDTLISSAGRPVRQVQFQATLLPTMVTASQTQITASVDAFLHGTKPPPKNHTAAVARAVHHRRHVYIHLSLVPTPGAELAQARTLAKGMSFPLEYPRLRDQFGSAQPATLRDYYLRGTDGVVHRAYVAAIPDSSIDQYYDVQGMTWTNAPLFSNPDQTIHVGGRTYNLYYDGASLKMVAWFEHGAAYWVRNSLIKSVGNSEMLAIAEETLPFGVPAKAPGQHKAGLGIYGLPARPAKPPRGATSTMQALGGVAGALALIGIAALAVPLVRRRRALAGLRDQLRASFDAEARARARMYQGAGSPYVARRGSPPPPAPRP
jgi:polyisoprenyl-teichoic acid--peptidoglycan teichoic acid transferase